MDSVLLSRFPNNPSGLIRPDLRWKWSCGDYFAILGTEAQIIGVEIQERLADMATLGALNSLDNVHETTDDLKHLPQHIKGSKVDII